MKGTFRVAPLTAKWSESTTSVVLKVQRHAVLDKVKSASAILVQYVSASESTRQSQTCFQSLPNTLHLIATYI